MKSLQDMILERLFRGKKEAPKLSALVVILT